MGAIRGQCAYTPIKYIIKTEAPTDYSEWNAINVFKSFRACLDLLRTHSAPWFPGIAYKLGPVVIDQAEYCSEKTFIGRDKSLGALFTDNLSTGTKTLLNISQHRDLCFDTIECGNNALTLLMGFTEGQTVLHPGVVWDPDIWDSLGVLDVVFDGNHFTDLCAISSYMQEMRCRYD